MKADMPLMLSFITEVEIREYFMWITGWTFRKTPGWRVAAASVCTCFPPCRFGTNLCSKAAVLRRRCSRQQSSFTATRTPETPYPAKTIHTGHCHPTSQRNWAIRPCRNSSCLACPLNHSLSWSSIEHLQGWRSHSFSEFKHYDRETCHSLQPVLFAFVGHL